MAQITRSTNHLLALLPPAELEPIRPHLRTVELLQGAVLLEAGDAVSRVYFPHSGLLSLVVELKGGEMIEAAMIGRRGVTAGMSALDGNVTLNKTIVEIAGAASVLDIGRFRQAAEQSAAFRTILIRHDQAMFAQVQQNAACNASHPVEARLSRWLLRARDITGSDTLPLTQEFLAQVLGVRRSSISSTAHTLQEAGLISHGRGHIEVANVEGLRRIACECYEIIKAHYDGLMRDLAS